MTQVNWLSLRLNIIPLLDRQVNHVLQLFNTIRNEIMDGDILAVQRLSSLKQSVAQRLIDLDEFYQKNCMDPRAKYLFAARTTLAKIASYNSPFGKINDYYDSVPWKSDIKSKNSLESFPTITENKSNKSKKSVSPLAKKSSQKQQFERIQSERAIVESKLNSQMSNTNSQFQRSQEKTPVSNKSKVKTPKKQATIFNQSKTQKNTGDNKMGEKRSSKKMEHIGNVQSKNIYKKTEEMMNLQQQLRSRDEKVQNSAIDSKRPYKDLSELVFTIKMTKQEYEEFIKLKRKNNHA